MRKIIEERLENARNDYNTCLKEVNTPLFESALYMSDRLAGQIEAYQDCLNLLPQLRTEQEILKDFEAFGYKVYKNDEYGLILEADSFWKIDIWKSEKVYSLHFTGMQEHKLLNELFALWGWL